MAKEQWKLDLELAQIRAWMRANPKRWHCVEHATYVGIDHCLVPKGPNCGI